MDSVLAEALPVLQAIMPGFVVTFIFYWLSDAPKPGQFERVIQALMSTVVIQVVVEVIRWLALLAGQFHSLGQWTDGVAMGWSVTIAVGSGLLLAKWANNDAIYAICRDLRLTSRSADGEWRFAHRTQKDRGVTLQLKDGRRLAGYPRAWPTDPTTGHYLIIQPTWIVDGSYEPADRITSMLISVTDVAWTEFLDQPEEEDES